MTNLVKAQLCELEGGASGGEVSGTQMDVQFNPTSLRVAISNKTAGGQQAGSQARQRPGTGEIQVSFDLVFDTSDEGSTEQPVPVTEKTRMVEKFVLPPGNTPSKHTPPRVQFKWGTFVVQGVMDSANTDLDLFSANGTPLRAKVAVSIKGQNPSYRYQPTGGAPNAPNRAGASSFPPSSGIATPPGSPGTLGSPGLPARVAQAMPGESLQQLAARNGVDPAAWRALAAGVPDPLSLPAGAEIVVPEGVRVAASVSAQAANAPDSSSVAAGLGLVDAATGSRAPAQPPGASAAAAAVAADPVRSGQVVAREGGVTGAIRRARASAQHAAVQSAYGAFGIAPPDGSAAMRPYGSSVPLRPWRGAAGERTPATNDPTVPAWKALPVRPRAAARALGRARPHDACGCDCDALQTRRRG